MNPSPETAGSPIIDLNSDDMACNVGGTKGVSRVQPVQDGALLTFEIRSWADDPSKERLDRGHKGPCAVYLKKVDSAVDDRGAGDGWFKLFDHGYNKDTDRWCSDEVIDNNGLLSVNLPKGLEGGYYLARPELLALHAANSGEPQFYTGCAQIFLKSSGNLVPESTVSIPGYVKQGEPSTSFDIYNKDAAEYVLPGPEVAKLAPRGTQSGNEAQAAQAEGLKPAGCLVENANWCGKEVASYSDEKGCWASSADCWAQSKECYASTLPTGNAGCELWATKCNNLDDQCNAGNFNGPPNKGKLLAPQKAAIDVGQIMATVGGGVVDAPAPAPKTSSKKPAAQAEAQATPVAKEDSAPSAPAKATAEAPKPKPTPADSYKAEPEADNDSDAEPEPESESESDDEDAASAPAPAPAPAQSSTSDSPAFTITVAPSSAGAPAPTAAPQCPKGWKCVTVTEMEVVTKTVYVTASADSYGGGYRRRAASVRRRRHAHRS
ncbi:hypothetical protein NX059_000687 [Plenodomus lindquistii]|nr:hypothetical protein NX059_000687 [Plenodomus lindquistii]